MISSTDEAFVPPLHPVTKVLVPTGDGHSYIRTTDLTRMSGQPEIQLSTVFLQGENSRVDWSPSLRGSAGLLEYFSAEAMSGRLQPGDKLVRMVAGGRACLTYSVEQPEIAPDLAGTELAECASVLPITCSVEQDPNSHRRLSGPTRGEGLTCSAAERLQQAADYRRRARGLMEQADRLEHPAGRRRPAGVPRSVGSTCGPR